MEFKKERFVFWTILHITCWVREKKMKFSSVRAASIPSPFHSIGSKCTWSDARPSSVAFEWKKHTYGGIKTAWVNTCTMRKETFIQSIVHLHHLTTQITFHCVSKQSFGRVYTLSAAGSGGVGSVWRHSWPDAKPRKFCWSDVMLGLFR